MLRQTGVTIVPILPFIIGGVIFSYVFGLAEHWIEAGSNLPYIFSPLFLALIGAIWPLLKESNELRELDSITDTERTRLSKMVSMAQSSLSWCILFLFFFFFCFSTSILTYLSSVDIISYKWSFRWLGFCVGISTGILYIAISIRIKLYNCKSDILSRIQDMKQRRKLIKRAKPKPLSNKDQNKES